MARWHSANVLQVATGSRQLWQFAAHNDDFTLLREQTAGLNERLPERLVRKDWRSLWQRKLNVAWLPVDQVFLRAVHLPAADFTELLSMVELQLEKISPLPVAQIVWTVEVLPRKGDTLETVIVIVVARSLVEEFLGQLEGEGYLADRLELPVLDQLLATQVDQDGVWIYPSGPGPSRCLVAWWYGGVLQNLTLLTLAAGPDQAARFREQLSQMAWAGELEGWLTAPPVWHLVADEATAASWQPILQGAADQPVQAVPALSTAELAALSARRAAHSQSRVNLLPREFATRYQQQFFDRLWMRGLAAILAIYGLGVLIYFGALRVAIYKQNRLQQEVNSLSQSFTNALRLKEQVRILEEQSNLKYAALDCWKAVADNLPAELTLTALTFQRGKTLVLNGTAPQDQAEKITDFNAAMARNAVVNGQPLEVDPPRLGPPRASVAGGELMVTWDFTCRLRTKEVQ